MIRRNLYSYIPPWPATPLQRASGGTAKPYSSSIASGSTQLDEVHREIKIRDRQVFYLMNGGQLQYAQLSMDTAEVVKRLVGEIQALDHRKQELESAMGLQPGGGKNRQGLLSGGVPVGRSDSVYAKNKAALERELQILDYSIFQIEQQLHSFNDEYHKTPPNRQSEMNETIYFINADSQNMLLNLHVLKSLNRQHQTNISSSVSFPIPIGETSKYSKIYTLVLHNKGYVEAAHIHQINYRSAYFGDKGVSLESLLVDLEMVESGQVDRSLQLSLSNIPRDQTAARADVKSTKIAFHSHGGKTHSLSNHIGTAAGGINKSISAEAMGIYITQHLPRGDYKNKLTLAMDFCYGAYKAHQGDRSTIERIAGILDTGGYKGIKITGAKDELRASVNTTDTIVGGLKMSSKRYMKLNKSDEKETILINPSPAGYGAYPPPSSSGGGGASSWYGVPYPPPSYSGGGGASSWYGVPYPPPSSSGGGGASSWYGVPYSPAASSGGGGASSWNGVPYSPAPSLEGVSNPPEERKKKYSTEQKGWLGL